MPEGPREPCNVDEYVSSLDAFDPAHACEREQESAPREMPTYPEVCRLHRSGNRAAALILGSGLFTLGGVWMISRGEAWGWLIVLFFGACTLFGIIYSLPAAAGMVVMKEGFATRALYRTRFYRWDEVGPFGVMELRQRGMKVGQYVAFHTRGSSRRGGAKLSEAMTGWSDCLPENYGCKPEALAHYLNTYRAAALANAAALVPWASQDESTGT